MITVVLVEDDEVFRIGLTVSLKQSKELELLETCSDGQSAVDTTERLKPDLVLMDIGLPVLNGIEATKAIKAKNPDIKILILTSHSEPKIVEEIMDAGADGFCLKGISTERLHTLIQEVSQGAFWVDAAVSEQIKQYLKQKTPTAKSQPISTVIEGFESLTEREQEVLSLVAEGKKNNEIAEILFISPGTVRVHVHSILNKLNVKDRTQAAVFLVKKQNKTE